MRIIGAASELRVRFHTSKTGLKPPLQGVFLLTIPRRFLSCNISLFVRLLLKMWHLFCLS